MLFPAQTPIAGPTTTGRQLEMFEGLTNVEYRRAFADEHVGTSLAFQIRLLREDRGWTQEEVAQRTSKAQETISQCENPDYGRHTLSTLKKLAEAFDVALLVRLVSFSELVKSTLDLDRNRIAPPSFNEERDAIIANGIYQFARMEWPNVDSGSFDTMPDNDPSVVIDTINSPQTISPSPVVAASTIGNVTVTGGLAEQKEGDSTSSPKEFALAA